MLNIYTVQQAQKTILRRDNAFDPDIPDVLKAGIERIFGEPLTPEQAVKRILRDIRQRGDAALRDWSARIDRVELDSFAIPLADMEAALTCLPADLVAALELAADRIRRFHRHQPLPNWTTDTLGGQLGQRVTAIDRVGIYVPGGTAPLPSSLMMAAIPAQVAGVKEIVIATPPSKAGTIPDVILGVGALVGIDAIYMLGGAQAIGALAFGTESIPRVDKIFGPGNLFVTLAKQQVYGIVGIDGLYGPTETVVIADESANPAWVAADMLAQAEHDILATAILLTPSVTLANAVQQEIERQLTTFPDRLDILKRSLTNQGGIVLTTSLQEACQLGNNFAPEHLCLSVENPDAWLDQLHHAGGIFLGERSFEVLGDYVAGPSHTMPTGGTARFASPLNVFDFVKINSIIQLDAQTSAALAPTASKIARAEHLLAHAQAAEIRQNPMM